MKLIRLSVLLLGFGTSATAYAIAPVVDAYNEYNDVDNDTPSASSNKLSSDKPVAENPRSFSLEQRLSIQEHQISNLNPLLVQTDDLMQKVQNLQGKVEEQEHRLKRLEEQIRVQYRDLEKRLLQKRTAPVALASASDNKTSVTNSHRSEVSSSTLPTAAGERAYQAGFQLLKNKQYLPAIDQFEDFIKKYPSDINLPNANYFLGQLYLLQGQPEQSISRFNRFITLYPQDSRIPDALLQLGLAYFAKGEKNTAINTFKKIIQNYPDSKAAQSAKARLQQFEAMISATHLTAKNRG